MLGSPTYSPPLLLPRGFNFNLRRVAPGQTTTYFNPVQNTMNTPLVRLEHVRVSFTRHIATQPVITTALNGIDWTLNVGEHWAIIGPNGAGKSTFLRIIRGEQRPDQHTAEAKDGGAVTWFVDDKPETTPLAIRKRIATVTSEMQEHYVRQQWQLSGEHLLLTGYFDSPLLYETPTEAQRDAALELARTLDVQHLLDMQLPAMSQGQLRKLLVARALVGTPDIVVLDEVCEGLDVTARAEVLETINRAARLGATILFASHRLEELPECITHGMLLRTGNILFQGAVQKMLPAAESHTLFAHSVIPDGTPPKLAPKPRSDTPLFSVENATVFINRKPILHDISWRIMPGENWAVCGSNGAGKSTLLRLLMGDERQAWGGNVRWFGQDMPDLNVIRQRIGYVSDRFQATYGHDQYHSTLLDISGEELVWSGFFASVGMWEWQQVDTAQKRIAAEWMQYMGLADYAGQRIRDMSYGRLRRFMLCRAVAPSPDLLLLDEPCSGLDPASRDHFLATLRVLARAGIQIVYVTHYASELIPELTHILELTAGRIGKITPCAPQNAESQA